MTLLYQKFAQVVSAQESKTALVSEASRYTYAELLMLTDQWAGYLYGICEARPRVALLVDDPLLSIVISFAVARLNGACVPTNPNLTPAQLAQGWRASAVKIVIYEPKYSAKVEAEREDSINYIAADADLERSSQSKIPQQFEWSDEDDFLITLSSGSTGEPKPIVLSQAVKAARAQQVCSLYQLAPDDVVLCASPYFHSLGQRLVYVPLLMGATLVYQSRFSPSGWLDLVEHHQVSFWIAVSSHLYALKIHLLNRSDALNSLNTIVTSSAPIDADFKKSLFDAIGCDFHEIYGATEVAIVSNLAPSDADRKHASVGRPVSGVSVFICDDDGNEVNEGETGEIGVKSPLAFSGYYAQPEMTDCSFRDGYFMTGDLGYMDHDGFLTYVSRKKDVIISGGMNIYPGDIEKTLRQQDGVDDVAVIGVEDELLGEVVVAICATRKSGRLEPALRKSANHFLASYQRPVKYYFVDNLPMTASGKIDKMALRKSYNSQNGSWSNPLASMLYRE